MKSLVMISRNSLGVISVQVFNKIIDRRTDYQIGTAYYHGTGIAKDALEKVLNYNDYYGKKMFLPYFDGIYSYSGRVMFINKEKYDKDPLYYQGLVKNAS